MRTIVIGDVHGCLTELESLMSVLAPRQNEHLVFCGDLVDKGPDSAGVVRYLRRLRESGQRLTLVEGNHEAKHARYRKHEQAGTVPNPIRGAAEIGRINAAMSPEDITFLESAQLYCRLPRHNALVVHAGVPPSVRDLPPLHVIAEMPRRDRDRYDQLLRVRHVNARGRMVALGEETTLDPFWSDVYDGRFGHVYFGHQPYLEPTPRRTEHTTGLDLGCCFGNKLCAAVLRPGVEPQFEYVEAATRYCKGFWE